MSKSRKRSSSSRGPQQAAGNAPVSPPSGQQPTGPQVSVPWSRADWQILGLVCVLCLLAGAALAPICYIINPTLAPATLALLMTWVCPAIIWGTHAAYYRVTGRTNAPFFGNQGMPWTCGQLSRIVILVGLGSFAIIRLLRGFGLPADVNGDNFNSSFAGLAVLGFFCLIGYLPCAPAWIAPMVTPLIVRLTGSRRALCDHCLQFSHPLRRHYTGQGGLCEHCGQPVGASALFGKIYLLFGNVTIAATTHIAALWDYDLADEERHQRPLLPVHAVQIDAAACDLRLVEKCLTYLLHLRHGARVPIVCCGDANALGQHITGILRNNFSKVTYRELTPRPPLLGREGGKERSGKRNTATETFLLPLSSQERGAGGEFKVGTTKSHFERCRRDPRHAYTSSFASCPWCERLQSLKNPASPRLNPIMTLAAAQAIDAALIGVGLAAVLSFDLYVWSAVTAFLHMVAHSAFMSAILPLIVVTLVLGLYMPAATWGTTPGKLLLNARNDRAGLLSFREFWRIWQHFDVMFISTGEHAPQNRMALQNLVAPMTRCWIVRRLPGFLNVCAGLIVALTVIAGFAAWPHVQCDVLTWRTSRLIVSAQIAWPQEKALERLNGKVDARMLPALTLFAVRGFDEKVRMMAVIQLRSLGAPAIDALTAALQSEERPVRLAAATALAELADIATPAQLQVLAQHDDPEICALGIQSFAATVGTQTLETLLPLLQDAEPATRVSTLQALAELGDPRAADAVTALLTDADPRVAENAALTLAQLGDLRAFQPALHIVADADSPVRLDAIYATATLLNRADLTADGQTVRQEAIAILLPRMADADRHIRRAATDALTSLGWTPDTPEQQAIYHIARQEWGECRSLRSAAVPALLDVRNDAHLFTRKQAVYSLGRIGDPQAVGPLLDMLRTEPDAEVRLEIITALGRSGDSGAVDVLLEKLRDPDAYVRQHAAEALGAIGDPRALDPLITALRQQEAIVRYKVAEALGAFDDPRAVAALQETLAREQQDSIKRSLNESLKRQRERAAQSAAELGK